MTDATPNDEQNKCPSCALASGHDWPWCNPTGLGWGRCLECDAPSLPRLAYAASQKRVRELEAELERMQAELESLRESSAVPTLEWRKTVFLGFLPCWRSVHTSYTLRVCVSVDGPDTLFWYVMDCYGEELGQGEVVVREPPDDAAGWDKHEAVLLARRRCEAYARSLDVGQEVES